MMKKRLVSVAVVAAATLTLAVQATGSPSTSEASSANTVTIDIVPVLRTQRVERITLKKPAERYQLAAASDTASRTSV